MNQRITDAAVLAIIVALMGCQPAEDLSQTASIGKTVEPGQVLNFPKDHGAHPEYGLEWWYLTANLWDQNADHHGLQYTLFRFRGPQQQQGSWWDGQWYMAHLMWEHNGQHQAWERFGRKGQAGINAVPFAAWLDNWQLASVGSEYLPLNLTASQDQLAIDIQFADSPKVLHGQAGFSDKSGDGSLASYYYSYPRLQASGTLRADGVEYQLSGSGWLDREWSSALLDQRFNGWDWLSINLDDGSNVMVFCLRGSGDQANNCEGSFIDGTGSSEALHQFALTPTEFVELDDGRYPIQWQLKIPDKAIDITVKSRNSDQRNQLTTNYWEGPTVVSGSHDGYGFIEMTGRGAEKG
ncbi:lipocalin-like domain-containing protein [Ferrimonas senticii]|uniref:lipocalin-like domain-containing protein n=1 Tax=Ferrimonas senticii TaxID=394566 RepID=UPI0004182B45|nr:lipocalin-like domain-containing protein [Ferrimonas senticii]